MAQAVAEKVPQGQSWDRPKGASFEHWIKSRIARVSDRQYDWNALKFQADFDPKYRRAQKRFIGTGATGVGTDENVIPAENFTLSNMVIPAGGEGPMHLHVDAEEVFFVLRGRNQSHGGEGRRIFRNHSWRARLHLGAAGGLPRRGECRRRGCDHDGHDRITQARYAHLSAGAPARQGQALKAASAAPPIRCAGTAPRTMCRVG